MAVKGRRTHLQEAAADDMLLKVEDLYVQYHAENESVTSLAGASFQMGYGDSLGIIGETGSGKTSLAKALMGLIDPPHQMRGRVQFVGRDILAMTEEQRRTYRWNQMALVFQNFQEVLNPIMTVGEQVSETIAEHLGVPPAASRRETAHIFGLVGLEPQWQEAYPHQLSGGMRQRVLLAMAVSCRPQLLVADEPTANLDAGSRTEILELLQWLQRELGFALIVISHDLAVVRRLTSKLMVLYAGEAAEVGAAEAILRSPQHPYTRGLMQASADLFPSRDLWGIPGEPPLQAAEAGCAFAPRCTQSIDVCWRERPPSFSVGPEQEVRCHRGGIVTLLRAEDVVKAYSIGARSICALNGSSITLRHGETTALIGPSGSGKSTLAGIVAGYIDADHGTVEFQGVPLESENAARREHGVQLVLQDPFGSTSHRLTVIEAVTEPLRINGIGTRPEQQQRAQDMLKTVQLPADPSFGRRRCHALSGGQRQRVALARALVMRPALLIADEITSMLDVSTQANLLRLLKGLQNGLGFSMLYITHDETLAGKVAEQILIMRSGVVEQKTGGEIFEGLL